MDDSSASSPHVVIFPFMAQGHTLPLLDLSKALSRRGLKITIITTPLNVEYIHSKVSKHPNISLSVVPFPQVEGLPERCENTADLPSSDLIPTFIMATKKLKEPFERILREVSKDGPLPVCVISDFFLTWTLDSCRSFGIPRLVSHGMGVLPMAICKAAYLNGPCIKAALDSDPVRFPELKVPFSLTKAELPIAVRCDNESDPWSKLLAEEVRGADEDSWGFVVNSFEELEGDYVSALESFLRNNAKAWCVGPLLLFDEIEQQEDGEVKSDEDDHPCPYIKWLNEQDGQNNVIYVSFGTQAQVSDTQMDEIVYGLEMAGHPFLLVARSKTWSPPNGWKERKKERGLIVKDWVEQRRILAHPSTGGFLSHCGWNSVLESLSMGVPLLAWPMGAEQLLNAKYVAEGLGTGILIPQESAGTVIRRAVICEGVKELMSGESGKKARERAQGFGIMAKRAMEKSGSSGKRLDQLIEQLTRKENSSM